MKSKDIVKILEYHAILVDEQKFGGCHKAILNNEFVEIASKIADELLQSVTDEHRQDFREHLTYACDFKDVKTGAILLFDELEEDNKKVKLK